MAVKGCDPSASGRAAAACSLKPAVKPKEAVSKFVPFEKLNEAELKAGEQIIFNQEALKYFNEININIVKSFDYNALKDPRRNAVLQEITIPGYKSPDANKK